MTIRFQPEDDRILIPLGRTTLMEIAGDAARAGACVLLIDPQRDYNARTRHEVGGQPVFHMRPDDPDLPVVRSACDLVITLAA
jgi:hypothetical protein